MIIILTNKFIKRELILKVYRSFKHKIYGNKWNYHEDNIWSKLITKYAKSKIILNKYMYLYLLNKDSLMNKLGNIAELKNQIYRFEMFKILYKNDIFILFKKLLKLINENKNIIKRNFEIRKKIINIFINFIIYCKLKKSSFFKHIIPVFL